MLAIDRAAPHTGTARSEEVAMTRHVASTALLVAGVYVLFQPFALSPWSCLTSAPRVSAEAAVSRCLDNPLTFGPVAIGLLVGITLMGIGVWELSRRR